MISSEQEELLRYYEQELSHLRRMGVEFARKYPKVAGRLEIGHDQSADPYVERLVESFAYLTARLRYNMESEFPQIPAALLEVLYPHYLHPIPSMAVARFVADMSQATLNSGHLIPEHTRLYAQSHQGHVVRMRTCYPVTLWPLEVTHAGFEAIDRYDFVADTGAASVLRMRIEHPGGSLREVNFSSLRFALQGELMLVHGLYEMLFAQRMHVVILPEGSERPVYLPSDAMRPVGFGSGEGLMPHPRHAHPQYRLLQEYFAFPEKFLFFDLDHLDRHDSSTGFDVLFLFDRPPKSRMAISRDTFVLGATPVINLFQKTTEPIRIDHLQVEYDLTPDARREKSTEIYSIERVSASSDAADDSTVVEPFYSYRHQAEQQGVKAFWYARRIPSERKGMPGTEMRLSLVDLNFKPTLPPRQTVFAHTLCTNRHSADDLPPGAVLQLEESAPVSHIYCIGKPSRQIDPPLSGTTYWRLISHLSLNYLSLSGGVESVEALKEILGLYAYVDDPSRQQQILGIRDMECRRVIRRLGGEAWRGFCQGTEITLTFDESMYVGSSAFLLASVLNQFLALYTSVNSFTQLVARSSQRKEIVMQWPPMAGEQIVL